MDGLGDRQLQQRGGHAPFLRHLRGLPSARTLDVGFPSTTATSMGTFGTGLLPGTHGLVGLDVLDPARDAVFSELAWDPLVDPVAWQPHRTLFEQVAEAGLDVARIGPAYFDGSGLTQAALRGGRFVAAGPLDARVDAAIAAASSARRSLVYLYWGEVDKVGHVFGFDSWQWGEEVAATDAALRRLVEGVAGKALVVVTADHGMVDVPFSRRLDLAAEPELVDGVRHVGGEPRALHLYCRPGAADDVVSAWRERVGVDMDVLTRDQAVRRGWFGSVTATVLPRIGDVVTSATLPFAVVDSRTQRPELLRLLGLHGARTPEESLVPLLVAAPGVL